MMMDGMLGASGRSLTTHAGGRLSTHSYAV